MWITTPYVNNGFLVALFFIALCCSYVTFGECMWWMVFRSDPPSLRHSTSFLSIKYILFFSLSNM